MGALVWRRIPNEVRWETFARPVLTIPDPVFEYGEVKPSAANTGLAVNSVSEGSLTTVAGNVTYNSSNNGQTITGKKFTGTVTVTGQNITFEDCWFAPTDVGGSQVRSVLCDNDTVFNLTFRYCKMRPSSFTYRMYNVFGRNFTIDRCDASGFVDCFSVVGKSGSSVDLNVQIRGSYFHEQVYIVPDANQGDGYTHNDGVQVHYGGKHLDLFGNTFEGTCDVANSSSGSPTYSGPTITAGNRYYPYDPRPISWVMMSPIGSFSPFFVDFKFRKNWAGKGVVGINWPRTDGVDIEITDNRWGDGTYTEGSGDLGSGTGNFFILAKSAQPMTITGNTYEATGLPGNVPQGVRHNG